MSIDKSRKNSQLKLKFQKSFFMNQPNAQAPKQNSWIGAVIEYELSRATRLLNIFKMGKGKKNIGTSQAFESGTCAFAKVWKFVLSVLYSNLIAQVRGYPAWPAKVVEQRHDGKYAVIFYGTLETANVQPTDIWPYDTPNTTKFCTEKNLKRPLFMEGMEQMKQALAKEGSKAANPVNSMDQEEADMVKVGRNESKEAADDAQGSSKGLKRKMVGAEHKVFNHDVCNTS